MVRVEAVGLHQNGRRDELSESALSRGCYNDAKFGCRWSKARRIRFERVRVGSEMVGRFVHVVFLSIVMAGFPDIECVFFFRRLELFNDHLRQFTRGVSRRQQTTTLLLWIERLQPFNHFPSHTLSSPHPLAVSNEAQTVPKINQIHHISRHVREASKEIQ